MADEIVTTNNRDDGEIRLDRDARATIMRALVTGLAAYGELEKLINACELRRICKQEIPDDLKPVAVSGWGDEIANFAGALQYIH